LTGKDARRPSAYKHGGFSKTVLFPWEDTDEFEALHRSLNHELNPLGALEEEAVYTILTCIWRKRRIRDKRDLDTLAALQEKDLAVLSEEPLPFFDTAHETAMYYLTHMPKLIAARAIIIRAIMTRFRISLALVPRCMEC